MHEKHTLTNDLLSANPFIKIRQRWSGPDGRMQMATSQGWSEGSDTELVRLLMPITFCS